ncbi:MULTISPECIES: desulfoferrodoxin family protein [Lacrimispora]|uniref:desulfoferrodoxin family protein n=1 Tax=Lacrimispora TaxID=2719231 RepID=UPI002402AF02|nr:desulfoferrodoxin FeS4 iron-binding domain-containing protein [Paenibacillaceae bacterium]MBE5994038.1 desulfoferrodoxin FeS4 iron-binding domain-containing protein [Paenibacillaceae bacterium]
MKFLKCNHCGNIVAVVEEKGGTITCCGDNMQEMKANTTDAATEKHVPVIEIDGQSVTVTVGSVEHPMLPEHFIGWIVLETKMGNQRKILNPGDKPVAKFMMCEGDEVVAAYEYCNLHGLWKAEK